MAEFDPTSNRVLLSREIAVDALSRPPAVDDGHGADGEEILRQMFELGVMSERSDGRIDIPDIYRHKYDIKRKGGVARAR
jgi:hypothetical protein